MIDPPQDPRWRALEIGPGGVPADQVRSIGPDGRAVVPAQPHPSVDATAGARTVDHSAGAAQPGAAHRDTAAVSRDGSGTGDWSAGPRPDSAGPSAVFGSFDDDRRRPSRKALLALLVLGVVVAAVTLSSLWADGGQSTSTADLRPSDCLSSEDDRSVVVVDCAAPDVEFRLAAKYDNTRDATRCSTISTDLVLVTKDDTVLCLNYRAEVGDCLYAGDAVRIGKAACREPGAGTPFGLYRVIALLPSTVDVRGCPTGTITTLVHAADREVLCLGLP
ncbi:MAG: hypothetical protein ABWZ98_15030 [Nakamurella sp.]